MMIPIRSYKGTECYINSDNILMVDEPTPDIKKVAPEANSVLTLITMHPIFCSDSPSAISLRINKILRPNQF